MVIYRTTVEEQLHFLADIGKKMAMNDIKQRALFAVSGKTLNCFSIFT